MTAKMSMMLQQMMDKELLSSFLEMPNSFYEWIGDNEFYDPLKYNKEEAKKIYQKNYNPNNFGVSFKSFNIIGVSTHVGGPYGDGIDFAEYKKQLTTRFDISANGSGFSELFFGSKNECKNIILSLLGNRGCVVNFSPIYSFNDSISLDYSVALK